MSDDQFVYVWGDVSKIHTAILHDGDMLSNERCNLDDIEGDRHIDPDGYPTDIDEGGLCGNCFPKTAVPEPAEV